MLLFNAKGLGTRDFPLLDIGSLCQGVLKPEIPYPFTKPIELLLRRHTLSKWTCESTRDRTVSMRRAALHYSCIWDWFREVEYRDLG